MNEITVVNFRKTLKNALEDLPSLLEPNAFVSQIEGFGGRILVDQDTLIRNGVRWHVDVGPDTVEPRPDVLGEVQIMFFWDILQDILAAIRPGFTLLFSLAVVTIMTKLLKRGPYSATQAIEASGRRWMSLWNLYMRPCLPTYG